MEDTQTALPAQQVAVQEHIDTAKAHAANTMQDLLGSGAEIRVLKTSDMIEGTLLSVGKNESPNIIGDKNLAFLATEGRLIGRCVCLESFG